jgi:exonuclease SbcC
LRLERPAAGGEDDDEAVFDLSVRQAGLANTIGLAFLSGSQRFRVAVALALAVGRFASRQARPLEAVIIDEGFGCLDRLGRLSMIEELQRLQRPGDLPNPLKRIILVSHHEDISDSFPVGYRLSNDNGTTEAKVFRK